MLESAVSISTHRHLHRPLPLRSEVHADLPIGSNGVFFARCMRRAASVSLMDAAMRLSALMLRPAHILLRTIEREQFPERRLPLYVAAAFVPLAPIWTSAWAEGRRWLT